MNGASSSVESPSKKRRTSEAGGVVLPVGFLTPLPPAPAPTPPPTAVLSLPAPEWASNSTASRANASKSLSLNSSKQFWKAGDYDGAPLGGSTGVFCSYEIEPFLNLLCYAMNKFNKFFIVINILVALFFWLILLFLLSGCHKAEVLFISMCS